MASQKSILSPISVLLLVVLGLVALLGNTRAPSDNPALPGAANWASPPATTGFVTGDGKLGVAS